MEALQYIYTSWKNGDSTEKGYMIYSRSEGITESECNAIKFAMQYLAPKEMTLTPTPQEIADIFPYSFSYFLLPTGRGCVAQSTYLGKDYSGRFGNYIIYALVFDVEELPCRPAEFFAEPYIKTAMTQEELDAPSPVPPLPPLSIDEYASVINDEQLAEFLFDKEEEFAQIISMILAAQDFGIPFYLNDTRENLVLWSAAVQRILPSRLAKKFTFSTYIGDHESMRSQKAKELGLKFHLIGVRPDANYFNYSTESRSNRQIVLDFLGGHMTSDIVPNDFERAMAASLTMDCEEVDSFDEFIDATSFDEISGRLKDAYLYYHLLKNDEFDFSEDNLKSVLNFGSSFCSETDNSDIGSKLLVVCQENDWTLTPDTFSLFWEFVCRYSGFMIFTLFDLATENLYQYAGEATDDCSKLDSFLEKLKSATPQHYNEYLEYFNSNDAVEKMLLYLTGHENPITNIFYIKWLLRSYTPDSGLNAGRPVYRLLTTLLNNVACIGGCEKYMIEILIATIDNQTLFENVLNVFMSTINNSGQVEQLCVRYVEISGSLTNRELGRFEQLLLEIPEATPLAIALCAKKISASGNPEEEFWRFYTNQRMVIANNPNFKLDLLIAACLNSVEERLRGKVAIDIISKIDPNMIVKEDTIRRLTDIINEFSVKDLSKMETSFLQMVCKLRGKVDKSGAGKIKATLMGKVLATNNAQHQRPVKLAGDILPMGISLADTEKSDYEAFIKLYFGEFFVLIQEVADITALTKIFYHTRYFSSFTDDYISAIKKLEKKEGERWMRILAFTCIYLVTAEKSEAAADELFKPVVRYLRTLDEDELVRVRQRVIQDVPSTQCEYLFDEVHRKEGFSEKLGNLFHKK